MTQKMKITGLAAIALLMLSAATLMNSCSKDELDNPESGISTETSSFWESDYRRHSLNDRVKTVIEQDGGDISYRYRKMTFDQKGNLLEDVKYKLKGSQPGNDDEIIEGLMFAYNAQNRMTKCEYYISGKLVELAEFTYGGANSHNVYIPSNIFVEDLRLQKGITGIVYTHFWGEGNSEKYFNLQCTSAKGNELIFRDNDKGTTYTFTPQGAYPAKLDVANDKGDEMTIADIVFGSDGIPTTLHSFINGNDNILTVEYNVKEGFLAMTSVVSKRISTGEVGYSYQYTYNDHGYLATEKYNGNYTYDYSYTYEYDAKGNWTKQTSSRGSWYNTTRTYEYWN